MKCKRENSKFLINFRLDKINFMTNLDHGNAKSMICCTINQQEDKVQSLDNQNVINDANKYYNQILHKRNNDFTAVTIYCLHRKSSFKRKLNCNTTWLGIRQKFRKKYSVPCVSWWKRTEICLFHMHHSALKFKLCIICLVHLASSLHNTVKNTIYRILV